MSAHSSVRFELEGGGNDGPGGIGAKSNQGGFFARKNLLKAKFFDGFWRRQLGEVDFGHFLDPDDKGFGGAVYFGAQQYVYAGAAWLHADFGAG